MAENGKVKKIQGFSEEEKAAMRDRAKEIAAEERAKGKREDLEKIVLALIAAMPEPDRSMAQKLHEIIKETAPDLWAKSWYGMPAYAKDDKVVCFFQSAQKFKVRYSTLGFSDIAKLDEGDMWPTGFALNKLTATEEKRIIELLKKAMS